MEKKIDQRDVFGALLTDLSKVFDCIPHDLIIAKMEAYGLDICALRLIHAYLNNRKQGTKVNKVYGSWKDIIFGIPQGSILGPLLFNTHLCDLFYFLENFDIASYADDTTIYTTKENKESVIAAIETSSAMLFKWFNNNFMEANNDKSNLLMSCKEPSSAIIESSCIKSSQKELLAVTIDNELNLMIT